MARALLVAIALMGSAADVGAQRAESRLIYLNRTGASLRPGVNDSRVQTSSVVAHATTTAPWDVSDADWQATMDCMSELWARFDVELTDRDPGNVPHIEALFGGSPTDVGLAPNFSGVSPFAVDCGVIENSIVFAFTDKIPKDPIRVCEVMSQEIAHSYGLDHELLASEVMSQLSYAHARAFEDQDVACGETTARPCGIATAPCRATQNSVQLLRDRLGDFGTTDAPVTTLQATEPATTGCSASNHASFGIAFALLLLRRRRSAHR